ncbi:MAG: sulfatase-like hydrolase/transferase [Chloroflexota bacterium]
MKNLRYYLHSLLFALIAPIAAYMTRENVRIHAEPFSIWRTLLVCIIFFIISAILSYLLSRDHLSAGMLATFAVLGVIYTQELFFLVLLLIVSAWGILAIVRRQFAVSQLYVASSMLALVLAVYFFAEYILFVNSVGWDRNKSMAARIEITASDAAIEPKPDIYYIVLDAYGGSEMLAKLHGFDNSEFISALEERGFVVPGASRSNYTRTIHSVGSSLNMQYLDSVEQVMHDSILWWPIEGTFWYSETRRFLESQGYQTVVVASGWSFTTINDADVYKQPYPIFLNEFEEFFFQNTNLSLFGFLQDFGVSIPSYDVHRRIVSYGFEQLSEIPQLDSPKFTLVHIVSPHPPFVFDTEGNPIDPNYPFTIADNRYLITPPSKYQQGYLDQLTHVNDQTIQAVDSILKNSSTPPIIILQGDHGPGIFLDAQTSTPPCFYERYTILNAYHLPGVNPNAIPQDVTPVNTFRIIFNHYFSAGLEILPNHQYFSLPETVHQFEDVTDRIDDACVFPEESVK